MECSSGAVRTACGIQADGRQGQKPWKKLIEKDCREWKFTTVDPQERNTWRSGLEVIKLENSLRLKIKHNDWLLADTCPQAANHCALF